MYPLSIRVQTLMMPWTLCNHWCLHYQVHNTPNDVIMVSQWCHNKWINMSLLSVTRGWTYMSFQSSKGLNVYTYYTDFVIFFQNPWLNKGHTINSTMHGFFEKCMYNYFYFIMAFCQKVRSNLLLQKIIPYNLGFSCKYNNTKIIFVFFRYQSDRPGIIIFQDQWESLDGWLYHQAYSEGHRDGDWVQHLL